MLGNRLNWIVKANTFNVLDRMPGGEEVYYFLQRFVTKSIPRKLFPTNQVGRVQIAHATRFKAYGVDLSTANLLEFGAGWDLYSNLLFYCMGVQRQHTVDIRRWVKAEAINAVIEHLRIDPPIGAVRVPQAFIRKDRLEQDLWRHYGITYRAPADASNLAVADGTFDLIATTSTLEHIPTDVLDAIIAECNRVLKPGGYMSHEIDYSDHYANADPNITRFNYLRFSDEEWSRYNPSIHFQNRMRSPYYTELFNTHGFEVVELKVFKGERSDLNAVEVSDMFNDLTFESLLELGGNYLLRKVPDRRI